MIVGVLIFAWPDVQAWYTARQNSELIQEFDTTQETVKDPQEADANIQEPVQDSSGTDERKFDIIQGTDELYEEISSYNKEIYENNQMQFCDAWSVAQTPVAVKQLQKGMFGYIRIPKMSCALPLYVGASASHMDKGAAVLGGTSVPIGGENTNSVIAGHRGWKRGKYFKQIEKLKPGDAVYITNPWGTLSYRVESISIIAPTDSDKVKIQEGKDMVTLVTCHPYRSHGKKRYVVYCVRDESLAETNAPGEENTVISTPSDGQETVEAPSDLSADEEFQSSEKDIQTEDILRRGCAILILGMAVFAIVNNISPKRGRGRGGDSGEQDQERE